MKEEANKKSPRKTKEEKLKVIKEASIHGVRETLDKYGVYPATYYSWKRKFEEMGLLAEKEVESKLKDELLKKKYPKVKRKYS